MLRRDRPAQHRGQPGPPDGQPRPRARSTSRARSAPSPTRPPLSIGDGELATTADAVVSVPEMFNYWLQPGRVDVGFLGAAQLDRFGNINTTVIGPYDQPATRLPGAGGAPEIAASCREVFVVLRQSQRAFVERVDFVTSVGFGDGPGDRERLGLRGEGPVLVITDLGVLDPGPGQLRAHAHPRAPRRHRRAGPGGHRLGPRRSGRRRRNRATDRRGAQGAPRAARSRRMTKLRIPYGPPDRLAHPAAGLAGLRVDRAAGPQAAARRAAALPHRGHRPGARRRPARRARSRPDPPARRRAARPADHRARPGPRRQRSAAAQHAGRGVAGQRGRALPAPAATSTRPRSTPTSPAPAAC